MPPSELLPRAVALHLSGSPSEALGLYDQVLLEKNDSEVRNLAGLASMELGCTLKDRGDFRGAQAALGRAASDVADTPRKVCAFLLLGETFRCSGQPLESLSAATKAIELDPRSVEGWVNSGAALLDLGRPGDALSAFQQALQLNPSSLEAWVNSSIARLACADSHNARHDAQAATALCPGSADAWMAMGNALQAEEAYREATEAFARCLQIDPSRVTAWTNLGASLRECRDLGGALLAYERALQLQPDYPLARFNRSVALLQAGRWSEGWKDYGARFAVPGLLPRSTARGIPPWQGGPVSPHQTVLLRSEQGFGDALQFIRHARDVARVVGRPVTVECPPSLHRLFAVVEGVGRVISSSDPAPECAAQAYLMDLPALLSAHAPAESAKVPYLFTPENGRRAFPWSSDGRRKVGLVWSGNPDQKDDRSRSIRLETLAPLFSIPGIQWFGLQPQIRSSDRSCLQGLEQQGFQNLGPGMLDFADTAAVLAELDLVVSVCTSVAHLAGGLGRPVWTLLSWTPCWRWGMEGGTTPWYPSMRLFRQESRGNWGPVVETVAAELRALASTGSSGTGC